MNRLKEFFGNLPIFQKQVERELEYKGIKPTQGVKKLELSRQVLRYSVIGILVLVCLGFVGLSYWNNKNNPTPTNVTKKVNDKKKSNADKGADSPSKAVKVSSDHLIKSSAKQRADEATEAFSAWYHSYTNHDTILEINQELLKEGSGGTSPIELSTKLIANLKAKFGDSVSDDFYTSLQTTFNFNPIVVDSSKGLTILKQNDDQTQWLNTWFLDTEKTDENTKISLRNDFPYEWADWRNKGQYDDKLGKIFTNINWDSDLNYEVIVVDLTKSNKNIDKNQIIFIIMYYNEKLGKWQVTGNIGGIV